MNPAIAASVEEKDTNHLVAGSIPPEALNLSKCIELFLVPRCVFLQEQNVKAHLLQSQFTMPTLDPIDIWFS